MSFHRPLVVALLVAAGPSAAQYVASTQAGVPYPALTSATPITLVAPASFPPSDRGRATFALGFTFPYYDRTYTSITVTANGLAFLEPSSGASSNNDFGGNLAIPNPSEPNAVIAPLWDDLIGNNPTSAIQQQAVTGANGTGLAIEWKDWSKWPGSTSCLLSFQVRLWDNGVVEFFYGPMVCGLSITATIGVGSPSGATGTTPFGCGIACGLASFDPTSSGNPVTYIRFGPRPGVDLQANSLTVSGITEDAGLLTVSSQLTMRNFGTAAGGPFTYRLWLAQDTIMDLDAGAPTSGGLAFSPTSQGPLTLQPYERSTQSATSTVPRPDGGTWYVVALLDDTNAVAETNELNNVVATSAPLAAGVDLVAQTITGPTIGGPGDSLTVHATFTNQGFSEAGAVPVNVWLSLDGSLAAATLVSSTTVTVLGGQNVAQDFTFVVPASLHEGDYFLVLQLNDTQVVPETNYTNDVATSQARLTIRQADLVMDEVRVERATWPNDLTSLAFFGEPIRVEAVLRNQGGATAPNVAVAVFLSDNELLNGFTDPFVGQVTGLSLAPGQTMVVPLTATVPTLSTANQPLARGTYWFFAAAVAPGLAERNPNNNFIQSAAIFVREPAPNLVARNIQSPPRGAVGETLVVRRGLANLGNRPAANVKYSYYLSANTIITNEDVLLPIDGPSGPVAQGTVSLPVDAQDDATERVLVPPGVTPGTYYLGVLLDPDNLVDEPTKADNGLAGQRLEVVAQALDLAPPSVPDALLGSAYDVQLVAIGAGGAVTFTPGDAAELPPGLTLTSAGRLFGTPTAVGVYGFTVQVSDAGRVAAVRRTMRVVAATASIAITTAQLPAPARTLDYDTQLGVAGGRAPYSWSVDSGLLPAGLTLSASGRLTGQPTGALGTVSTFTLRVRDVVGNTDARQYSLTIVDSVPFRFVTHEVPGGVVGTDYLAELVVTNANAVPVVRPVTWSVGVGRLPDGLALEPSTSERVLLSGTPAAAGLSRFSIDAVDAEGRITSETFLLLVLTSSVKIGGPVPAEVLRASDVAAQLVAQPSVSTAQWFVRDGQLPPGLSLAPSGQLAGTVDAEAPYGPYVFTVGYGVTRDSLQTMRGYRVDVVDKLTVTKKCGCSGVDGAGLLALLAVMGLRRRRPAHVDRLASHPASLRL